MSVQGHISVCPLLQTCGYEEMKGTKFMAHGSAASDSIGPFASDSDQLKLGDQSTPFLFSILRKAELTERALDVNKPGSTHHEVK